jgi:hypothetical protein
MVGSTGSRLLVTLSVWFVAGGAVLVQSWSYYWTTGLIAGAALIFAFIVTLALWAPFVFPWVGADTLRAIRDEPEAAAASASKSKRAPDRNRTDDRMDLLLSLMTPEERADFVMELRRRVLEDRPVGDEGEIAGEVVALEKLLRDRAL